MLNAVSFLAAKAYMSEHVHNTHDISDDRSYLYGMLVLLDKEAKEDIFVGGLL